MELTKLCVLILCCAALTSALRIESSRLRGRFLEAGDGGEIVLGRSGLNVYIKKNGLAGITDAVSLMDRDSGKYVRHHNGKLYLDAENTPRAPETFKRDATFLDADDDVITFRFQSVDGEERYVRVESSGEVRFDAEMDADEEGASLYNAHLKEDSTFKMALD